MGHPLLEEFCRANNQLRPEFYRRCQRVFREEVNPMYERGEQAAVTIAEKDREIAELRAQLEAKNRRKEPAAVQG